MHSLNISCVYLFLAVSDHSLSVNTFVFTSFSLYVCVMNDQRVLTFYEVQNQAI
jgi:hypothetical protein